MSTKEKYIILPIEVYITESFIFIISCYLIIYFIIYIHKINMINHILILIYIIKIFYDLNNIINKNKL